MHDKRTLSKEVDENTLNSEVWVNKKRTKRKQISVVLSTKNKVI